MDVRIPADAELAIYLLEVLARESVMYRTPDRFTSRARKAWHRISTEEASVHPGPAPGVWKVRSERPEVGWHTVNPYELACDCEDQSLQRYRAARVVRRYYDLQARAWKERPTIEDAYQQPSPICHHVLMAAFAEAGRLAAGESAHVPDSPYIQCSTLQEGTPALILRCEVYSYCARPQQSSGSCDPCGRQEPWGEPAPPPATRSTSPVRCPEPRDRAGYPDGTTGTANSPACGEGRQK